MYIKVPILKKVLNSITIYIPVLNVAKSSITYTINISQYVILHIIVMVIKNCTDYRYND